jgi:hypothetical protein
MKTRVMKSQSKINKKKIQYIKRSYFNGAITEQQMIYKINKIKTKV